MKRTLGISLVLTLVTAGLVYLSTRPRAPLIDGEHRRLVGAARRAARGRGRARQAEEDEAQQPASRDPDRAAGHHDAGRFGGGRTDDPRCQTRGGARRELRRSWRRLRGPAGHAERSQPVGQHARRRAQPHRADREHARPPSSRRRAGSSTRPGACSTVPCQRRTSSRASAASARRPTTATRSCATTRSPIAGWS